MVLHNHTQGFVQTNDFLSILCSPCALANSYCLLIETHNSTPLTVTNNSSTTPVHVHNKMLCKLTHLSVLCHYILSFSSFYVIIFWVFLRFMSLYSEFFFVLCHYILSFSSFYVIIFWVSPHFMSLYSEFLLVLCHYILSFSSFYVIIFWVSPRFVSLYSEFLLVLCHYILSFSSFYVIIFFVFLCFVSLYNHLYSY